MHNSDMEYSNDLLFAVKYKKNTMQNILLYLIALAIALFIIFIVYATIDERVRGSGKIIPKTRVVNIQSLDGGIIDIVYPSEGDRVKQGDKLVKLNPLRDLSDNQEIEAELNSYRATKSRLMAEIALDVDKNSTVSLDKNLFQYTLLQKSIFDKRVLNLTYKIETLKHQKAQKISQIKNIKIKIKQLEKSKILLLKEKKIKEALHQANAISIDAIYRLQRELNTMVSSIDSYKETLVESQSALQEIDAQTREYLSGFKLRAIEELEKIQSTIERLSAKLIGTNDRLYRTTLRSSVNGVVKNIYFSHANEVIKGGEIVMDIVPTDDNLVVEAKVNPKDIAFIAINQEAIVNITAYDFSVYGGLSGRVMEIGVDSVLDKMTQKYFYTVKVLTEKNYLLGKEGEKLNIIPGMVAEVNIVTGKKSIFDFIFKPIIKTYKNALHER